MPPMLKFRKFCVKVGKSFKQMYYLLFYNKDVECCKTLHPELNFFEKNINIFTMS